MLDLVQEKWNAKVLAIIRPKVVFGYTMLIRRILLTRDFSFIERDDNYDESLIRETSSTFGHTRDEFSNSEN